MQTITNLKIHPQQQLLSENHFQFCQQFTFSDNVTNRKIVVKDMIKFTSSRKCSTAAKTMRNSSSKNTFFQNQNQKQELEECVNFIKSTSYFKINSLRAKLYEKKINKNTEDQNFVIKNNKRLVRNILQESILQINKQQFRNYLENPSHRPKKGILGLNKHKHFNFNAKNVSNIIQKLDGKEKQKNIFEKIINIQEESQPFYEDLKKLQIELGFELKEKIRKNGEYLINPKKKTIQRTIKWNKNQANENIEATKQEIKELEFNKKIELRVEQGDKDVKREDIKQLAIRNIVIKKQLEDLEIYIKNNGIRKCDLEVKDERKNSLVHLAAEYNKIQVFQYLIDWLGVHTLIEMNKVSHLLCSGSQDSNRHCQITQSSLVTCLHFQFFPVRVACIN